MDKSSKLKVMTLRLLIQTLGLLLIFFGVITIISFFDKLPVSSFRDIRYDFIRVIIAGASIVSGYKLVRLHHTGRQWSAMVILAIILFMISGMSASLTEQKSKFAWEIWTFRGELSSPNAISYFDLFNVVPFGVILLGCFLIGFLASGIAKNALHHPT